MGCVGFVSVKKKKNMQFASKQASKRFWNQRGPLYAKKRKEKKKAPPGLTFYQYHIIGVLLLLLLLLFL